VLESLRQHLSEYPGLGLTGSAEPPRLRASANSVPRCSTNRFRSMTRLHWLGSSIRPIPTLPALAVVAGCPTRSAPHQPMTQPAGLERAVGHCVPAEAVRHNHRNPATILVVDDDPILCMLTGSSSPSVAQRPRSARALTRSLAERHPEPIDLAHGCHKGMTWLRRR
jgi:hypothetical protein